MRQVVFHADDLGMCHAANTAFAEVAKFGLTRCGSVMVPCPWFAEFAQMSQDHAEWDIGVHLTLTSEWKNYRWGPISTRNKASGLLDADGYLWRSTLEAVQHIDPVAGKEEMRAQIETALAAGMDVTHLDSHMGSAFSPRLFAGYVDLACEYRLPAFITHITGSVWPYSNFTSSERSGMEDSVEKAIRAGLPIFSGMGFEPLTEPENRETQYEKGLAAVGDGLTHFLYHPSTASAELSALAPDHAARESDLAVFTSPTFRDTIIRSGVGLTGYRDLRNKMRAA